MNIAYDANGNTLTDAQGRSFTWDFENRLTQVVVPGAGTVTFEYDPLGRRIQKNGPSGIVNYVYDVDNLLGEVDNTATVMAQYSEGPGIDQLLSERRSGTTVYYQQDDLGSVTSLSLNTGALGETYSYDSFGKTTGSTGTLVNHFGYTGRELDPETGIYNYRARYYDQNIGRFLTEDPLGFKAGPNFYTYVDNDPLDFVDPSGKLAELYCEQIAIFTGGFIRASEKLTLALLGFVPRHCFLRIACKGKDRYFELWGPDPDYRGGKYGRPMISPFNRDRADSLSTEKVPINEPSGTRCCEFEQRLEDSFRDQLRQLPPYSPLGPNSNTFVLGVINGAGGSANLPFAARH